MGVHVKSLLFQEFIQSVFLFQFLYIFVCPLSLFGVFGVHRLFNLSFFGSVLKIENPCLECMQVAMCLWDSLVLDCLLLLLLFKVMLL